jgi:hypothetical protein
VTNEEYGAQYISAFSNNFSYLSKNSIPTGAAGMTDLTTMQELDILNLVQNMREVRDLN